MEQLSILANIAEIIGVVIVVGGLIFAGLQLRQYRQQRRELAAIELLRFFGNPSFTQAFNAVLHLPDGISAEEIRASDGDLEEAAVLISSTMENIGVMTFQRIVPFTVVNHLIGASAIILWQKLKPWTEALRVETDNEYIFEWFQWLVDRLSQFDGGQSPAYELYSDWMPRHLLRET